MRLVRHPAARLIAGDDGGLLDALGQVQNLRAGPQGLRLLGGNGTWLECHSGGSTGAPKIIGRTVASWIASFEVNAGLFDIGSQSVVATLGHIGHSLTFYALTEAAHLGAGVLPLAGMRPDRQAAALKEREATHLWATPSQLHLLVGGGALDAGGTKAARAAFPHASVTPFYGASETSFVALDGAPYPGVEIQIRDGKIWTRSPYAFTRYVSGADASTRWDRDGYLSLGELGSFEGGALVVTGRGPRLVNVADQLVSPEASEAYLSHGAQTPVIVIPRADPARGTVLHAVRAGSPDPDRDARLLAACRRALGPHATPRAISVVDELPMLPSGKTDLAALARLSDLSL